MVQIENRLISVKYEPTEYDDEFFEGKSVEIKEIEKKGKEDLQRNDIEKLFIDNGISFAFYKSDPGNIAIKRILHELNFVYVNCIADLAFKNVQSKEYQRPAKIKHRLFDGVNDLNNLKAIISSNFRHGKFYEDPYISHLATKRHLIIIDKYFKNPDIKFFIAVNEKNDIAGYFIHKPEKNYESLIFAGVNQNASYVGLGQDLWNLFHIYLKENGVKKTKTMITLTNLGVLNIYVILGYTFMKPKEEYHFFVKHLEKYR